MCSMRPATESGAAGHGSAGPLSGERREGQAEEAHGVGARERRFDLEEFVHERDRRRTGRVTIIHHPEPVLYGIQLADGKVGYAYGRDLAPATDVQVEAYHKDARRWADIRAPRDR